MKLVGEEQEIRALFYELKAADKSLTPEFVTTWERFATTRYRPQRALKVSFVLASVLLVIAACSIGMWWQVPQSSIPTAGGSTPTVPTITGTRHANQSVQVEQIKYVKSRSWKTARRRIVKSRSVDMRLAVAVTSWQLPTATLMGSPGEELLTDLPQFDESVTELRMFLPDAVRRLK